MKQPGFNWKCAQETNFTFCWEASLQGNPYLAAARRSAEAGRDRVLGGAHIAKYDAMIYVFFLESPERMEKLIGYHGEGRSRPAQHAVFFVPTPIRPDLTHELCHEILTNAWGVAEAWIEEGFATLMAQRVSVNFSCLSLTVHQTMLPLKELVRPGWNASIGSPDITYPELGGFVEFLERTYGLERVRQVWQHGSTSIPGILGKSMAALEREWHAQLQHDVDERSEPQM